MEDKLEGELIVIIKLLTGKEVNIGARGALVLSLEEFEGTDIDQLIKEEEKKSLKKIAEVFNKHNVISGATMVDQIYKKLLIKLLIQCLKHNL